MRWLIFILFLSFSSVGLCQKATEAVAQKLTPHTQSTDAQSPNEKESNDKEIAVSTLATAIFTGFLAIGTIGLWRQTGKTVRLAREEFIASHRPRVVLRNVSLVKEGDDRKILYSLVNIGESKATIINKRVIVESKKEIEPLRNIDSKEIGDHEIYSLNPGEPKEFGFLINDDQLQLLVSSGRFAMMDHFALQEAKKNKQTPWTYFAGSIQYKDNLGYIRNSVFRRKYKEGSFYRMENPDLEYAD